MRVKKILSLAVVLAMVLTVMPAAFAANKTDDVIEAFGSGKRFRVLSENLVTDGTFESGREALAASFKSWNGSEMVALHDTIDIVAGGHDSDNALQIKENGSANKDNNNPDTSKFNFVYQYMLNEGKPVTEEKTYAITMWVKAVATPENGHAGTSKNTITMGASSNADGKDVDNTCNLTGVFGNDGSQNSDQYTKYNDWDRVSAFVKTKANETVCLEIFPRWAGGYYYDDIEIYEVEEIKHDASITVNIVDQDGNELAADIAGTGVDYYAGDTFNGEGISFDNYFVDVKGKRLYEVAKPKDALTLEKGLNDYNLEATLYKELATGENIINNPSFEDDDKATGWTADDGQPAGDVLDDESKNAFQIVHDVDADLEADPPVEAKKQTSDGKNALYLYGGKNKAANDNEKIGHEINTAWDVKPGTKYFASVDVMSAGGASSNARFYIDHSKAETETPPTNPNGAKLEGLVKDQFVTKQYIIDTAADTAKIGFSGNWFLNDGSPIVDNFQLYELKDLDTDITYSVIATTDGTEKGTELGKKENLQGTVGEPVAVKDGDVAKNKRVGKDYYTNKASEEKLVSGKTVYYVGADVVASIIGTDFVSAVGDYEPILPGIVKTVVDHPETVTAEALPVTWDGTKGTVADTGLTLDAAANKLAKTYGLVDTISYAGQDNYERVKAHALKLPKAVDGDFAVEFEVTLFKKGDNWIFLNDAEADYFGDSQICLGFNDGFVAVDGDGKGGRNSADASVMTFEEGKTYTVLVEVDAANNKYTATVKNDAGEVAVAADRGFRKNNKMVKDDKGNETSEVERPYVVNSFVSMTNNGTSDAWIANDNNISVSNIQVYQDGAAAPTVNSIKTGLCFIDEDGDDKDALAISVEIGGDIRTKSLVVTAIDANGQANRHTPDTVVYTGETKAYAAIIPSNANMNYEIAVVDEAGVVTALERYVVLAPMVIDDIAKNVAEYAETGQMARVEKAVEALGQIGLAYQFFGDNPEEVENPEISYAEFVDGRDEFIKANINKDGDKIDVTLTMNEGLFANGFGFKVGIKAGELDGKVGAAALPEGVEGTVFKTVTVTDDGTVTVQAADGTVYTFSLDSVEIEFVATEMADADAADADAAVDFIPEL